MVLKFSKKNSNYNQQNIVDVLMQAARTKDPNIYQYITSNNFIVKVEGDIHRSQWTADNTQNNYWIKIKIYDSNMMPVSGYTALHIYVCFQTYMYHYQTNKMIFGNCINPLPKKGTDIADISNLNGFWTFVDISYGINPQQYFFDSNNMKPKSPPKKQPSKKLDIINPKTGKKIKILN